jgi:hypothetical protein
VIPCPVHSPESPTRRACRKTSSGRGQNTRAHNHRGKQALSRAPVATHIFLPSHPWRDHGTANDGEESEAAKSWPRSVATLNPSLPELDAETPSEKPPPLKSSQPPRSCEWWTFVLPNRQPRRFKTRGPRPRCRPTRASGLACPTHAWQGKRKPVAPVDSCVVLFRLSIPSSPAYPHGRFASFPSVGRDVPFPREQESAVATAWHQPAHKPTLRARSNTTTISLIFLGQRTFSRDSRHGSTRVLLGSRERGSHHTRLGRPTESRFAFMLAALWPPSPSVSHTPPHCPCDMHQLRIWHCPGSQSRLPPPIVALALLVCRTDRARLQTRP